MREFLIAISGEWRPYIVGWSILFFFLFSCLYRRRLKKYLTVPEDKDSSLGWYYWFGLIICPYILYSGLYIANIYSHIFNIYLLINSALIIIYFVYSILFYLSISRIDCLQRHALYNTKSYLISFPFFTILMPICSFILCVYISGEQSNFLTVSLDDILYSKNPSEYVKKIRSLGIIGDIVFNIIFIIPWIIYFHFSSTMKKLWSYIDSEFDHFHEGENILPKWVLD